MQRRKLLKSIVGLGVVSALPVAPFAFANRQTQNKWQNAPSLPVAMQEIYPAVFDGHIAVSGALEIAPAGQGTMGPLKASANTHLFNPKKGEWTSGPTLPEERHHLGMTATDNVLFGIGGFASDSKNAWQVQPDCFVLESLSGKWQRHSPLPQAQGESVYAAIDNKVHVIGGRTISEGKLQDTADHWILDGDRWHKAKPLGLARNSAASCVTGGKIYVAGGRLDGPEPVNQNLFECYNPSTDTWEKLPPMPIPSAGLACAATEEDIFVFGGEYYRYEKNDRNEAKLISETYKTLWRYSIKNEKWTQVIGKDLPAPRHGHGAVIIDDVLYVLGGSTDIWGKATTSEVITLNLV